MPKYNQPQVVLQQIAAFRSLNPGIDLLQFDFLRPRNKDKIKWDGVEPESVLGYQRLLRIVPDEQVVEKLLGVGLRSSHQVANYTEQHFIREYKEDFGGDEQLLSKIHRRAVLNRIRAQHLLGNFKDLVASPYYRSTRFANVEPEVVEYFNSIPSYQDLFGSLDYCECEDCRSILSPAAYFVDLMRVTDEYIIRENPDIPPGYSLHQRRPDLAQIPLTCQNTNTLIPYLDLVNNILVERLALEDADAMDVYEMLAREDVRYPRILPFNLPLVQTRIYLNNMNRALWQVYHTFEPVDITQPNSELPMPFDAAREYLNLSSTQYEIVSTTDAQPADLTLDYGVPADQLLPLTYDGTVSITEQQKTVTRVSGSPFSDSIHAGDTIQVQAPTVESRIVETVSSDSMTVSMAWTVTAQAGMVIYPRENLTSAISFLYHTDLTWDGLISLLYQGLNQQERDAGIAATFIINYYVNQVHDCAQLFVDPQSPPNYLRLVTDTSNADVPVERITPLSNSTLGILSQFIRLSKIADIAFADLDWALTSINKQQIDQDAIEEVALIKQFAQQFKIGYDEVAALYWDIKTIGVVDVGTPQDLFDRLFNNRTVMHAPPKIAGNVSITQGSTTVTSASISFANYVKRGDAIQVASQMRGVVDVDTINNTLTVDENWYATVPNTLMTVYPYPTYHPRYECNPLYKDEPLIWTVNRAQDADPSTRNRLLAAFSITDNELTLIGNTALDVLDIQDGMLPLTVPNMSLLYSYSKMPSLVGLTVDQYMVLLQLAELPRLLSPLDVKRITDLAEWLNESGLDIYALRFVLTGQTDQHFRPGFVLQGDYLSTINTFLTTLWSLAATWLLGPGSFLYESITPEESARYLSALQNASIVSPWGVVYDVTIEFSSISWLIPLSPESFVTNIIALSQAEEAYAQLQAHEVLSAEGYLSSTFTRETDLSYLFEGDPDQALKISQVQSILLTTQSEINYIVKTLLAFSTAQEQYLAQQFAMFLGSQTDIMLQLAPFTASEVHLANYVAAFLQPPPPSNSVPSIIVQFLDVLSRSRVLTGELNLSAYQIGVIASNPQYFNITSLARVALEDVHNLYIFKKLERTFNDPNNALISYFETPYSGPGCAGGGFQGACAESEKFNILAQLTYWPILQICTVVCTFWPDGDGYNSVLGVKKMKDCFDLAAQLGADINTMLHLAQLAKLGPSIDSDNWDIYNSTAEAWLQILNAKYSESEWPDIYNPIRDKLNEQKRDALAGRTIYVLQQTYPEISTLNALYDYLLIDVQMSGCAQTSRIKQAISSVQLYMQRCRMSLEIGVDGNVVPPVWWEWLLSYRIWEANRKIFLYPENYLEPELRKDQTPLFAQLGDDLLSTDVTPEKVNLAYLNYFDQFVDLASLLTVGTFYCPVTNPDTGETIKTLFFFARTPTSPYVYYYRTLEAEDIWSAWTKLKLTINAPIVTPIFVFDKLFIFWTEMQSANVPVVINNNSQDATDTQMAIKYSFYNFSKQWIQPQTLTEIVADYVPTTYTTQLINPNTFDLSQIQWQEPQAFITNASSSPGILLTFAQYFKLLGGIPNPSAPTGITNADERALAETVYEATLWNNASISPGGQRGISFVNQGIMVDDNLNTVDTPLNMLAYDVILDNPMPYLVKADLSTRQLNALQCNNIFIAPYWSQGGPTFNDTFGLSTTLLFNISATNGQTIAINNQPGWFSFNNGDEAFLVQSTEQALKLLSEITQVRTSAFTIAGQTLNGISLRGLSYTGLETPPPFGEIDFKFSRLTTGAVTRLSQNLFTGGIEKLLSPQSQITPATPLYPFSRFYQTPTGSPPPNTIPPTVPDGDTITYDGPYGMYYWEVFFFIPFMIGNHLKVNQRFREAKDWYEYIFNPTISASEDNTTTDPTKRYWQFVHFRDITVETLKDILTSPAQINAYNNDPFDPNAIAQLRPSAYQKAIVMRYIDNLIEWGDMLFARDTWESINEATLLYTLASDLLGPRPVNVGACVVEPPATYADIREKYGDEIPQFLIYLENALPLIGDVPLGVGNRFVPFNNLGAYFCVNENEELIRYWDQIEDRLFKIRHCMNIQGSVRQLPLYEPPINPRALIRAAGAGQDLLSVVSQWQPAIPSYRFNYIIEQAKGFTGQLMQLGSSLLAALEKQDAEQLAFIRQTQELAILGLTTYTREKQMEAIEKNLESLRYSRESAVTRYNYFKSLVDRGLSPAERLSMTEMQMGNEYALASIAMRGLASGGFMIPQVGSPFAMTFGGQQIGNALQAASAVFDFLSAQKYQQSQLSLTKAGYNRREQDWTLQMNLSALDIQQIDAQIAATDIQLQIAKRELEINLKSIEQAAELDAFLKDKFTNLALYQWMISRISTVYFQSYNLALSMSWQAQQTYQYELSTNQTFINFQYWDSLKKGLLAGEQLMLSLSQLADAYTDKNARPLEIERTISLLQLDPKAVLDFRQTGKCSFQLDELLFDEDYAGQYCRKITALSISIPTLVGPYQNLKATLTQVGNAVLIEPNLDAVAFLLSLKSARTPPAGSVRYNWRSNQQIALSTGVDDTGVFQLNFDDPRYLPFEGTGTISRWELNMPKSSNWINYDAISDVVIRLRYTALNGGEAFKQGVITLLNQIPYTGQRAFNLASEFSSAWYAFMHPPADALQQQFTFKMLRTFFPYGLDVTKITEMYFQLQLAPDVTLDGTLTMTLQIGEGATARQFTLVFDNKIVCVLPNANLQNFFDLPWTYTVMKADIPSGIKDDATGFLSPEKLFSLFQILTYQAQVDYSS